MSSCPTKVFDDERILGTLYKIELINQHNDGNLCDRKRIVQCCKKNFIEIYLIEQKAIQKVLNGIQLQTFMYFQLVVIMILKDILIWNSQGLIIYLSIFVVW